MVVDELRGILEGGSIEASGTYDLRTREIDGRVDVEDLSLASLLPPTVLEGVVGTLDFHADLEGSVASPRGQARATSAISRSTSARCPTSSRC